MKKLFIAVVAAFIGFSANAQLYVGGNIGFTSNSDAGRTSVTILPEVGYSLDDNMSVGAVLGFQNYAVKDSYSSSDVILKPYFRYTFLELGPVKLFADAQLQLDFSTYTPAVGDASKETVFGIGIAPGIAIPVSDNLSFVGHLGRVGYYDKTLAVNFDANNVLCGVYYSF